MEELSVRKVAREAAARLRERFEARRAVAEALVDSVTRDAQGKAVRATATIQGVPKVPIEISYGANIQEGARIVVTNVGSLTAPRWVHSTTAGGIYVGTPVNAGDAAGGDLGGTYPNPFVLKLRGRVLSGSAPRDGDLLRWRASASEWAPDPMEDEIAQLTWFYGR